MGTTPPQVTDERRLASVAASRLVLPTSDPFLDRIAHLVGELLPAPVALVSIVDAQRQVFKGAVGLVEPWASRRETPLTHSFCQYVVATDAPLVVTDAREDEVLRESLAVADLGVVAYCGVPLRAPDGTPIGSLCGIDVRPRDWTTAQLDVLSTVALLLRRELELRERREDVLRSEARLRDVLQLVERDLGASLHLAMAGAKVLADDPTLAPHVRGLVDAMARRGEDAVHTMERLVAVGRAIADEAIDVPNLPAALETAVVELRDVVPDVELQLEIDPALTIEHRVPGLSADQVSQVVGGLLRDRVARGPGVVRVEAGIDGDRLVVEVVHEPAAELADRSRPPGVIDLGMDVARLATDATLGELAVEGGALRAVLPLIDGS